MVKYQWSQKARDGSITTILWRAPMTASTVVAMVLSSLSDSLCAEGNSALVGEIIGGRRKIPETWKS
jgi:hypothetical protein